MKKWGVLLFALVLSVIVSACSSGGDSGTPQNLSADSTLTNSSDSSLTNSGPGTANSDAVNDTTANSDGQTNNTETTAAIENNPESMNTKEELVPTENNATSTTEKPANDAAANNNTPITENQPSTSNNASKQQEPVVSTSGNGKVVAATNSAIPGENQANSTEKSPSSPETTTISNGSNVIPQPQLTDTPSPQQPTASSSTVTATEQPQPKETPDNAATKTGSTGTTKPKTQATPEKESTSTPKLADPKGKRVIIIGRDHCVTKGGCEDDLIAKELRKAGFRVDFVGEQKATLEQASGYDLVWLGNTLNEKYAKEGQFVDLNVPQIHSKSTGLMALGLLKKNYSFDEIKVPRVQTLAFATEKERAVNLAGSPLKEGFSKDEVVIYKEAQHENEQIKAGGLSMEAKCTNIAASGTNSNSAHIYVCPKGTKAVYGTGTTKAAVAHAFNKGGVHNQLTEDGWKLLVNLARYMTAQK